MKKKLQRKLYEDRFTQTDGDHLEYIWFLESMNKINQAVLGTNNIEIMMSDVLDTLLTIFDCDRAWLVYPCDPNAGSWQVPMERTKPEYPGANALGLEIPMDTGVAKSFSTLLVADGPVKFGPGTKHPLPEDVAKQFGFKCFMSMAVYPKIGSPWQLGMHQCSHVRTWKIEEERLFQEIGRRMSDALTSLLMYRDLRKSEALNKAIVNAIPDLLFLVNKDGIITDYKKPDNIELYLSPEIFLGKPFANVLPSNISHPAKDAIEKAFHSREVALFEYFMNNETKSSFYEGRVVALSDSEVLIVVRDVTKQKHAEKEIDRINRALRILNLSNHALIHYAEEEPLLNEVCKVLVETGGYKLAWVRYTVNGEDKLFRPVAFAGEAKEYIENAKVSYSDYERGVGPDVTAFRTKKPCIVRNVSQDIGFTPLRKTATQLGFNSMIALPLIGENQVYGVLGIYSAEADAFNDNEIEILVELTSDLAYGISTIRTKKKYELAQQEVVESERRFKELADMLPQTIFEADLDGNIIFVNKAALDIYGYSVEDVLSGVNMINMVIEKDRKDVIDNMQRLLFGLPLPKNKFEMLKKDGSTFPVLTFTSLIIKDGKTVGFRGTTTDITEIEKQNYEYSALNQRYVGLNEDLQRSNEKLVSALKKAEESDLLKTAFLENMSHEIRTPLNSIMGFSSLLPDEESNELIRKYANIIEQNSEQLVHVIDTVVLYSKLQSKSLSNSVTQIDLLKLLNDIKQSFGLLEQKKGINFGISTNETVFITSDYEKLRQVLTNLVANAFKYTSEGSITIGFERKDGHVRIFVKDTGIGIPKNEIEQIFERFYRASNVNKASIGGTGLGLSIAKELIELIGGNIWVESEDGKGSSFYIEIV